MLSKIKLLHLINGFAVGGAEKHLLHSLGFVDRDRYDVTICSVRQGGPLESEFRDTGFPVEVVSNRGRYDISLITRVADLIRCQRPHILQTTLYYADIIGTLAAQIVPVPVIISVEHGMHDEDDVLRVSELHVIGYRWAMKQVDKIVAVSDKIRDSIIQYRNISWEKVITIRNGIDSTACPDIDMKKKRAELGLLPEDLVVGIIARLDAVKGHSTLFRALASLKETVPRLKCLVIGDGCLRHDLEEEVLKAGLGSCVIFCGFRNDVPELLRCMDVLALPSLSEGLPITLLEAMVCKIPVVASRVGGIPEVVIDGLTGFLVPPEDPCALSGVLSKLLKDRGLRRRVGMEGKREVEKRFSIQNEMSAYDKLYCSFIKYE